ncbi:hypothetical protein HII31_02709 [Pseudocercospora fuligena]|uniref:Uncharacterized protein n=1 Tax=Pseudocercospora fuligena TaxID=685502 RepID=A0A8H6RRH9_9PEZI|nr:hypothetical protein HII31_02709 [Pseudocercospora fuligena]
MVILIGIGLSRICAVASVPYIALCSTFGGSSRVLTLLGCVFGLWLLYIALQIGMGKFHLAYSALKEASTIVVQRHFWPRWSGFDRWRPRES